MVQPSCVSTSGPTWSARGATSASGGSRRRSRARRRRGGLPLVPARPVGARGWPTETAGQELLAAKYGAAPRAVRTMFGRVEAVAAEEGLTFQHREACAATPSTRTGCSTSRWTRAAPSSRAGFRGAAGGVLPARPEPRRPRRARARPPTRPGSTPSAPGRCWPATSTPTPSRPTSGRPGVRRHRRPVLRRRRPLRHLRRPAGRGVPARDRPRGRRRAAARPRGRRGPRRACGPDGCAI